MTLSAKEEQELHAVEKTVEEGAFVGEEQAVNGMNGNGDSNANTEISDNASSAEAGVGIIMGGTLEKDSDGIPRTYVPAHLFNTDAHPWYIRYGIPLFLTCIFGLLLASDLGSGVSAELRLSVNGEVEKHETILTVSIFSSVAKLWETESYPLAILIVITSIMWPYIKLAMSMFAWVTPPVGRPRGGIRGPRRRERLVEWLDALGKWSFVDIFVLIIMMVAFRTTVPIGGEASGVVNDVYIVPKWGFFGFVFASVFSLLSTHLILHLHRRVIYPEVYQDNTNEEQGGATSTSDIEKAADEEDRVALYKKTGRSPLIIIPLLAVVLGLLLAGCILTSFTFTYEQGIPGSPAYYYEERDFSIINIGLYVPDSAIEPNSFGIRFVQAFYFLLAVVTPLQNVLIFAILYLRPLKESLQRWIFFLSEITFAWGAVEVMMISAIFSVNQIPDFGSGIVDSGCTTCYVVGAILQPTFWIYFVAAVLNFGVTFWLFEGAHVQLYNARKYEWPKKRCWC